MKKIILITILVLINIPSYSYANWACLIKDKSAQVLLDYIKNNRKVVENISNSISKDKSDRSENDFKNISNEALTQAEGIFNEIFSFPWYYSYAKYFAFFPTTNEIPYEVKRDYKILEDENNWLINYLNKINSKWVGYIMVNDPCKWVDTYCDYKAGSVKEILWELIQNSDNILDLYRLTVMWDEENFKISKLKLVNNNFILEIKKYYSTESIKKCSDEEWWFFYRIKKSIKNIGVLTKEWEDWIQEWKDAWQLLMWTQSKEDKTKTEKDVLTNYLQSVWINMNYQEIMQGNLDKYNLEWVSLNNNFVTNTFELIKSNTANELKRFKEEIFENSVVIEDGWSVSIREIKLLELNSEKTKRIQEEITILYQNELPFAAIWDISTEHLRSKIVDMHNSLENTIKNLDETIPKSQNTCKQQGGWWNCK